MQGQIKSVLKGLKPGNFIIKLTQVFILIYVLNVASHFTK